MEKKKQCDAAKWLEKYSVLCAIFIYSCPNTFVLRKVVYCPTSRRAILAWPNGQNTSVHFTRTAKNKNNNGNHVCGACRFAFHNICMRIGDFPTHAKMLHESINRRKTKREQPRSMFNQVCLELEGHGIDGATLGFPETSLGVHPYGYTKLDIVLAIIGHVEKSGTWAENFKTCDAMFGLHRFIVHTLTRMFGACDSSDWNRFVKLRDGMCPNPYAAAAPSFELQLRPLDVDAIAAWAERIDKTRFLFHGCGIEQAVRILYRGVRDQVTHVSGETQYGFSEFGAGFYLTSRLIGEYGAAGRATADLHQAAGVVIGYDRQLLANLSGQELTGDVWQRVIRHCVGGRHTGLPDDLPSWDWVSGEMLAKSSYNPRKRAKAIPGAPTQTVLISDRAFEMCNAALRHVLVLIRPGQELAVRCEDTHTAGV
jgi:hypothetical protein